ncbi:UNVERIFIED_CONTAM: hypothetical protein GTU68_059880 [Idotea baltica]|nr:hypothetical protein [Idotea baltica]
MVVRDISLSVKSGEVIGLLGPNGAGKTTCFYMITGLIAPDLGDIALDDVTITELPMYKRARLGIGYLPQESSIFRGLTVEQNIQSVLEIFCNNSEDIEHELDQLLADFSLTHIRKAPAPALSGGERRRVEIARCLAAKPKFLLLDEPLAGIDPIAVGEIKELISILKKKNLGVLITDHNVRETLSLIDRAYIIHDGKVLMEGSPKEVIKNKLVKSVYLGDSFVEKEKVE